MCFSIVCFFIVCFGEKITSTKFYVFVENYDNSEKVSKVSWWLVKLDHNTSIYQINVKWI